MSLNAKLMKSADKFKYLRTKIASYLKERSFSRKGFTFYINQDNNYGLINFQKSIKSKSDVVIFTINVGIISSRLLRFYSEKQNTDLSVDTCHWRERVGFLLPSRQDKWWTIDPTTNTDLLYEEILDCISSLVIPQLNKYMSDEMLRDLWLSGRSLGLTNFQRLVNLSVILKSIGPSEKLQSTIDELRQIVEGTPTASVAEYYIHKLEGWAKEN